MKTILVATDFSDNSENALLYTLKLNKTIAAEIILFHSYFVAIPAAEIPVAIPSDFAIAESAMSSLKNIKEKYEEEFPGTHFKTEVSEGFAEQEIFSVQNKFKPEFTVLGSHGIGAFKKYFVGSTTAAVLNKSLSPLIIVPETARFKHLNKIVFAANYGIDDFKNVYDLIRFARLFNSEVILLHVSTGMQEKAFDFNELSQFKYHISEDTGYDKISLKLFEDKDVYEGLNLYLEQINADMFSISMRNRSFFKSIFAPSLTKKMSYQSQVPLMVFHTDY